HRCFHSCLQRSRQRARLYCCGGSNCTTTRTPLFVDTFPRWTLESKVQKHPFEGTFSAENMDETLRQIGELLLGSIPTIIFFLLLYGLYVALVYKPMGKILAERRARTEGAIEKARADVATAEARTAEY